MAHSGGFFGQKDLSHMRKELEQRCKQVMGIAQKTWLKHTNMELDGREATALDLLDGPLQRYESGNEYKWDTANEEDITRANKALDRIASSRGKLIPTSEAAVELQLAYEAAMYRPAAEEKMRKDNARATFSSDQEGAISFIGKDFERAQALTKTALQKIVQFEKSYPHESEKRRFISTLNKAYKQYMHVCFTNILTGLGQLAELSKNDRATKHMIDMALHEIVKVIDAKEGFYKSFDDGDKAQVILEVLVALHNNLEKMDSKPKSKDCIIKCRAQLFDFVAAMGIDKEKIFSLSSNSDNRAKKVTFEDAGILLSPKLDFFKIHNPLKKLDVILKKDYSADESKESKYDEFGKSPGRGKP